MTLILSSLTEKVVSKEDLKTYFDGQKRYSHPELTTILKDCYFASYSYDGTHSVAKLYALAVRFRTAAEFCTRLGNAITETMDPMEELK